MAVDSSQSDKSEEGGKKGIRIGSYLPYAVAVLLLIMYFVWMCIEMSTQAPGGGAVPLSIFGAVLLGVLAGGLSMVKSRRRDE
ncbi:MAG TPA: hypothetical protein VG405_03655 [Solirubrobacteraceae bacterium]|jgi:hypothetical protein|nr:hypothetical protein [Solirubrobacteraceae bacterium]